MSEPKWKHPLVGFSGEAIMELVRQGPNLTDHILSILGIEKHPGYIVFLHIYEYDRILNEMLVKAFAIDFFINSKDDPGFEPSLDEACANQLPVIVEKFLNPPLLDGLTPMQKQDCMLDNGYMRFLAEVAHGPYFLKYLQSKDTPTEVCKLLARTLVERLLVVAPNWDKAMEYCYSDAQCDALCARQAPKKVLSLLLTVLSVLDKHKAKSATIPSELRSRLARWLRKWAIEQRSSCLGIYCAAVGETLLESTSTSRNSRNVRRAWSGWDKCALPSCEEKRDLKACTTCKTVRYCSRNDQRMHWKGDGLEAHMAHKARCFQTVY